MSRRKLSDLAAAGLGFLMFIFVTSTILGFLIPGTTDYTTGTVREINYCDNYIVLHGDEVIKKEGKPIEIVVDCPTMMVLQEGNRVKYETFVIFYGLMRNRTVVRIYL